MKRKVKKRSRSLKERFWNLLSCTMTQWGSFWRPWMRLFESGQKKRATQVAPNSPPDLFAEFGYGRLVTVQGTFTFKPSITMYEFWIQLSHLNLALFLALYFLNNYEIWIWNMSHLQHNLCFDHIYLS